MGEPTLFDVEAERQRQRLLALGWTWREIYGAVRWIEPVSKAFYNEVEAAATLPPETDPETV